MRIVKPAFLRTLGRALRGAYTHTRLSTRGLAKRRFKYRACFGTVYDIFVRANRRKPDRSIYNLLQAFNNYVMVLDPIIDKPSFRSQHRNGFTGRELRQVQEVRPEAATFVELLKKCPLTGEQRNRIVKTFSDFRRSAVKAVEMTMKDPFASKEKTFEGIEKTSGPFFATLSDIACICHGLSEGEVAISRKAFANFSNALQIKDDMRDAVRDFGKVQNAAVSIAVEHPEELAKLKKQADLKIKPLSTKWLYKNLPKTMAEADRWFEKYYARIPDTKMTKKIRAACRDAYYGL